MAWGISTIYNVARTAVPEAFRELLWRASPLALQTGARFDKLPRLFSDSFYADIYDEHCFRQAR